VAVFTLDVYTVGKNDLLLASSLLAALYYFYETQTSYKKGILGFALASGLAASIKPNALYVLFPLWLFLFIRFYKRHLASLVAYALLLIPGLLWLVRNFITLGSYAGADASRLASWSIAANLNKPLFLPAHPQESVTGSSRGVAGDRSGFCEQERALLECHSQPGVAGGIHQHACDGLFR
jgi:4-amino-4-deoxy-L-arabinose transferase-like glycosyltransferase